MNLVMFYSSESCIRQCISIACSFGSVIGLLTTLMLPGFAFSKSWTLEHAEQPTHLLMLQIILMGPMTLLSFLFLFFTECKAPNFGIVFIWLGGLANLLMFVYTLLSILVFIVVLIAELFDIPTRNRLKKLIKQLIRPTNSLEKLACIYMECRALLLKLKAAEKDNNGIMLEFQIYAATNLFNRKAVNKYGSLIPEVETPQKDQTLPSGSCSECGEPQADLKLPLCNHEYHTRCLVSRATSTPFCSGSKCNHLNLKQQLLLFSSKLSSKNQIEMK